MPLLARWALPRITRRTGEHARARLDRAYGRLLDAHGAASAGRRSIVARCCWRRATVALFYSVGTGFLPAADEGGFVVDYLTPAGSALAETDRQVRAMEQVIADDARSRRRIRGAPARSSDCSRRRRTRGDILVRLKPRGQREPHRRRDHQRRPRPKLHEAAPLADIEFVQLLQDMLGDLEGNPEPIEVKIFGDDPDRLAELAEPVEEMLEQGRRRRRRRRHAARAIPK